MGNKNKKEKLNIEKFAKEIAKKSVGRSIPIMIHEPKVPKKLLCKDE